MKRSMLRLFDSAVVRFARGCAAPAVRAARLHLCDDLLVFQGAIVQHMSRSNLYPGLFANSRNLPLTYRLRRDKLDGRVSDGF